MEDKFITHLLSHPDDQQNRIVYADWLLEHGKEKEAMFILFPVHEVPIEFKFKIQSMIEVRCPKCNNIARGSRPETRGVYGQAFATVAERAAPLLFIINPRCCTENCEYEYYWFNYSFISGNTYKFRNGIYKYYGGFENKWFVKIE